MELLSIWRRDSIAMTSPNYCRTRSLGIERQQAGASHGTGVLSFWYKCQNNAHTITNSFQIAKALLKKTIKAINKNSKIDEVTQIKDLDTIAQMIQQISPKYEMVLPLINLRVKY